MGRHEPDDINTHALGRLVLWLAISLLLFGTVLAVWQVHMDARAPLQSLPVGPLPPTPRLQDRPRLDLAQVQHDAAARLNGYGWVDKARGTVHIPIGQAMRLVAQEEAK
ncbi:MAG TPA: hypothetical protein VGO93_07015 [Candidatus Xenobia bacterium]|jgi:hypothetical protein